MPQHDPYGSMLEGLRELNNIPNDEALAESLTLSQHYVTKLREAYLESPSNVDFSCKHTRAAYLLAYYPNYIEPIYEILCELDDEVIESAFYRKHLRGVFLGAGPAPEVLGWIKFINDYAKHVKQATAYLLDKHVQGWRIAQEITRGYVAPSYWGGELLTIKPMELDFLSPSALEAPFIGPIIGISDMVVIQNCLNDQLANKDAVFTMLLNIFSKTAPGALFVISDLHYDPIRQFIQEFTTQIEQQNLGKTLIEVKEEPRTIRAQFSVPQPVLENLLTGDESKHLIAKKYTKFYYAVCQRIYR
ncbi:MAG: hypothetical protein NTW32_27190 [Chloroflexi bacterium]|nr:hypothetical protein [Chloroflexota bacterium]